MSQRVLWRTPFLLTFFVRERRVDCWRRPSASRGYRYFDEPPFSLLQAIVAFNGVLITIAVLIRQNRLARVEEDRAHLELHINLLAEQKTPPRSSCPLRNFDAIC